MMKNTMWKRLVTIALLTLPAHAATGDTRSSAAQQDRLLFASVGDTSIYVDEYNRALLQARQRKFYHGTPPEGAIDQLRHDVAREVITRELLLQEAARYGLRADEAAIEKNIAEFDRRYADSQRWKEQRETMIVPLQKHYREQDLLRQLEVRIRKVAPPERSQLEKYYQANQDKFTEPAQHRLSLILLRVDPSSSKAVWDAAMQEGDKLIARLADGAEFAELARMHSSDATAAQGGEMGYLHAGMLSPAAEEVIAGLQPGEVSAPIRLLEGIAILRLEDRRAAQLRQFVDVSERARELWLREQSDLAWQRLKDELWEKTPISVHDEMLTLDKRM
jgi:parvulin-like peptidyl-prolyl isomerase